MIAGVCLLAAALASEIRPHLDVKPEDALVDEPVAIVLGGVAPGSKVTIALRGWGDAPRWSSSATFVADANGVVDVTRMAPLRGDYQGVDPMGLFWSAHRDSSVGITGQRGVDTSIPPPEVWHVTASIDGTIVAEAAVTRRAGTSGVTIPAVRDRGLVGAF